MTVTVLHLYFISVFGMDWQRDQLLQVIAVVFWLGNVIPVSCMLTSETDFKLLVWWCFVQVRLPPLSSDPDRCIRAFVGNTIGQANGVADKVLDLRMCDFSNDVTNLKGKTLSSALMSNAKFDGADLTEVVMSKAYAVGASFKGILFSCTQWLDPACEFVHCYTVSSI